jgi:adenylate cyclase
VSKDETKIDFGAEGLLDGVEGEAREARLELLEALAEQGVTVDEMRQAIAEERLVLLPVERALGGEFKYTVEQVAEISGIDLDFLSRELQALGLPVPEPGDVVLNDEDLEAARRAKGFLDAGLPEEGIIEVARVIGMSMARLAEASQALIGDAFLEAGATERDVGLRYAAAAKLMIPLLGHTMQYVYGQHLREGIKQAVMTDAELASGKLPGSSEVTVAFADLAGFTSLGERVEVDEIGEVSGKLTALATSLATSPVRLVKMIGDAAMLVSPEPEPLLDATLSLVEAVEEDEGLPSLRAGVARGEAIGRAGDWYGRPVNLASRITGFARDASVVVNEPVKAALDNEDGPFSFSFAGKRRFKGIDGETAVYRARRAESRGMLSRALGS